MLQTLLRRIHQVNERHPWSHNDHYHRWLLRRLPLRPERVLDVGCGTGNLLQAPMSASTATPSTGLDDIRAVAARVLPGARIQRRLFWRYTLDYRNP
jgi:2-polyprenyl-3-methyl-5-hydroxy-6-metoxy-1,4-benzoquinol methylase